MELKVLGSSSNGNCYILDNGKEALIIELGCKLMEIKEAMRFDIGRIVGAIVSHSHDDHSKYVKQATAAGILVLALKDVFKSKGVLSNPFAKEIQCSLTKGYKVGGFKIRAFKLYHDVPCAGYEIVHDDMGKMLFITDTAAMGIAFKNVNHVLIEANYSDEIVDSNIINGKLPYNFRGRLLSSHLCLETTKGILSNQDLSNAQNIILIHLSSGNSNETQFVSEIEKHTGRCVIAAKSGMVLDVSKTPY